MEERLKRRLVGAVVLVSLAVIFLPMLVEEQSGEQVRLERTNIPSKPVDGPFKSGIVPLPEDEPLIPPLEAETLVETRPMGTQNSHPPPDKPRVGLSAWVVQVASLSNHDNAQGLVKKLRSKDYPAFLEQVSVKGRNLFRVRVGPEIDRKRAERMAEQIRKLVDLKGQVIRYP